MHGIKKGWNHRTKADRGEAAGQRNQEKEMLLKVVIRGLDIKEEDVIKKIYIFQR